MLKSTKSTKSLRLNSQNRLRKHALIPFPKSTFHTISNLNSTLFAPYKSSPKSSVIPFDFHRTQSTTGFNAKLQIIPKYSFSTTKKMSNSTLSVDDSQPIESQQFIQSNQPQDISQSSQPQKQPLQNQQNQQNKKQKQQQHQQQQPKKPSINKKDFSAVFNHTFPDPTPEYVDTHCHIDAILGRLNRTGRGAATSSSETGNGCCGAPASEVIPSSTEQAAQKATTEETAVTPETTQKTDTTTAVSTPEWTVARMNKEYHLGNWGGCVTVCCEPESFDDVLAVLDADDSGKIRGAFGVHPHEAKKWDDAVEAKFSKVMENPKVIAWGECGLDFYYSFSEHEIQKKVFTRQIELAVKFNKPLVVHTREAEQDTLDILLKHCPKDWKVHIHCCTSSVKMIQPLLDYFPNLYVGFTGVITFKNVDEIIETVRVVPLNRLLLETDGPYMAPMPFRGAVAHSGMIPFTALKLAEIKETTLDELMLQIRKNTRAIYGF